MKKPSTKGMTVAEVLIAMVLLVFVIGGSLSALSVGLSSTRHARMVTLCGQITQSVMEQLRLSNYTTIKNYAAQTQPVNLNSTISADNFTSNFTAGVNIQATFTTQVASSSGVLGKTLVVVKVTWPENGVTFERTTTTIFSEKGMSDYIYAGWK